MKRIAMVLLLVLFSLPISASALSLGFGGKVTFFVPCTCPPYGLLIYFTPLFINSGVPLIGPLYYPLNAKPYPYYNIGVPSVWSLGSFTPGPGKCSVGAPPATPCVPVPTLGTIKEIGTSLPGL